MRSLWALIIVLTGGLGISARLAAQESTASPAEPAATPPVSSPGGGSATPPSKPADKNAAEQPMPPANKPSQPQAGEKQPEDSKSSNEPKIITREDRRPNGPADPTEFDARPDAQGRVAFSFQGQQWQPVLVWLAKISGKSLDWQELPGDYLNLRTQRRYTVSETRDLINRHLLARGFTLLEQGEVLSVVNLKKLDPSLVPTIEPVELYDRLPHDFVKTIFPLDWLIAEKAAEDFKPLLSPNGQLIKLPTTNRILAIDAVVNLREMAELLAEEQSGRGQDRLVRSFPLKHVRAELVRDLLEDFLGLKKKSPAALTPEQIQQQQMMAQQAAQRGQNGQANAGGQKDEAEISLLANARENAIIASAPPDKMAVIEETVKLLDVPNNGGESLLRNVDRMQVYQLVQIDPEPLVKVLSEVGNLDPRTRLEVDSENRAVIAYATLADHLTIRTLINKLDGPGRRFKVIPLRRLEADYVAGTIRFMMSGKEDESDDQNNPFGGFYFGFPTPRQPAKKSDGQFRVDADIESNRLLLWANDVELEEVQNLLVQLGELPSEDGRGRPVRILNIPADEAEDLLERLRRVWPSVRENPLQIDEAASSREQTTPGKTTATTPVVGRVSDPSESGRAEDLSYKRRLANVAFTEPTAEQSSAPRDVEQLSRPSEDGRAGDPPYENPADRAAKTAPPVRVYRTPDGRLVIGSQDLRALDALEDLVSDLAPPARDFHVFRLKHSSTWAYGVAMNLEEFFAIDKESKSSMEYSPFWGVYPSSQKETPPPSLSRRRELKFIPDSDSGTILVLGADRDQLATIQELIDLYDQPPSQEAASVRRTKLYYLKYADAQSVATAIKDVYRDLLSANDAAFQSRQNNNQEEQRPAERSYTYIFGASGEGEKSPEPPIKFKGLLSIGVDEESNTLIVSAAGGLLDNIGDMVEQLDQAARPNSVVQVVPVDGSVDMALIQEELKKILAPTAPTEPEAARPGRPDVEGQFDGQGQPGQNGRRGRNRGEPNDR